MIAAMVTREEWLRERRAAVTADYNADASMNDEDAYPATSHDSFVRKLLETSPAGWGYRHPLVRSRQALQRQ